MPSLSEILPIEDNRQNAQNWNKVHLYKQGRFWCAYDWSAWLVCVLCYTDEVRKRIPDSKPLKVTRKERTDVNDTYCVIGFPVQSVEKFIPNRIDFESDGNAHLIVTISLPEPKHGKELTYESLNNAFRKWMSGYEIKENSPKKKKNKPALLDEALRNDTAVSQTVAGGGLFSMILCYPLAERNAIENQQFIQQLKNIVTSIL